MSPEKRNKLLALAEHPATPEHEAAAARAALESAKPKKAPKKNPKSDGADIHVGDRVYITAEGDFHGLVCTIQKVGAKGHTTGSDATGWVHHQWPYDPNCHIVADGSGSRIRQIPAHGMLKLVPLRELTADETDPEGKERDYAAASRAYERERFGY